MSLAYKPTSYVITVYIGVHKRGNTIYKDDTCLKYTTVVMMTAPMRTTIPTPPAMPAIVPAEEECGWNSV